MNRKTFLWVVALAIISIGGIFFIQLFWMEKAFDLRNKQFEHNVNMALLNVSTRLCEINQHDMAANPIEQLSSNYFIVNLNDKISPNLLEAILTNEFQQREIAENFEYGIFDCANKEMVYGRNINLKEHSTGGISHKFPTLKKDAYYFGVYFPEKSSDLTGEMWIWGFSSSILVIVVLFFGYALFAIFRQRQLSDVQTDFINNMTHEFKTPIATISIASDVLKSDQITSQPERLSKYADIIKTEANRLQSQVDRILQIATIEKPTLSLTLQPTDINVLIQQVITSSDIPLSTKNGSISFDPSVELSKIPLDKMHITNVFHNLIDNAIKYNEDKPQIHIKTNINTSGIDIIIEDNGIGIQKKEVQMVFNKFYRVSTGNIHNVKGFGLGLYYVKIVIEAHKGTISIKNNNNKAEKSGTRFIIHFPLHL